MYHPWRALRRLIDWTFNVEPLPAGVLGITDHERRLILIAPGQSQAQRRSTITHELVHVGRGPAPLLWREHDERRVRAAAARQLIELEDLIDALRWSRSIHELADELWVDVPTAQDRLDGLRPYEMDVIVQALDEEPRP